MKYHILYALLILIALSCDHKPKEKTMEILTEKYVKLLLEIGQYDSDIVDAFYGPDEWKPTVKKADKLPFQILIDRVSELMTLSAKIDSEQYSPLENARLTMFKKQLLAVKTKLIMMDGKRFDFDKEAELLYDVVPPHFSGSYFNDILLTLEKKLPGEGSISSRYNNFVNQFIIPKDKLDTVFRVAIAEARKRTSEHITLPKNENFVLEYVNDKSWSGYNYYQGGSQSLIQINTDFPIFIQRAIDLACHEGYPGHHVFNALIEQNLVDGYGWKEFSIYPLFSPQSLIAEGSANYGIDVAFPGVERVDYEKKVLFPIAGLDASKADLYYEILDLRGALDYAGNEAARNYLNGDLSREECANFLVKYSLSAPDKALQRTRFFDQYRSYVINYNLGKDIVSDYVEAMGGTNENTDKRWEIFKELLSNPHTASSLLKKR
ncbi:MAG: hypothetical protein V3V00_13755 [Saprospiraceae bacterium]